MKKGIVIVCIIFLFLICFYLIYKNAFFDSEVDVVQKSELETNESDVRIDDHMKCTSDQECVPATCCHATEVVNKNFSPNCSGRMCTMSCETILDCGRGKPVCNDGFCDIDVLQ